MRYRTHIKGVEALKSFLYERRSGLLYCDDEEEEEEEEEEKTAPGSTMDQWDEVNTQLHGKFEGFLAGTERQQDTVKCQYEDTKGQSWSEPQ